MWLDMNRREKEEIINNLNRENFNRIVHELDLMDTQILDRSFTWSSL